jgi:hypothetical protein
VHTPSELLFEIFFDRFDEQVQVRYAIIHFLTRRARATTWEKDTMTHSFRVTACLSLVMQLLALLDSKTETFFDGLLLFPGLLMTA